MNVIRFENVQCRKVSKYLDSYIDNELTVETNHETLAHLETCAECRAAFEDRLRVRDGLRRAVRREKAPAELREQVRQTMRRGSYSGRYWLAAAASVVLMFGIFGLVRMNPWSGPAPIAKAPRTVTDNALILTVGLNDHVHCAIEGDFAHKKFSDEQMTKLLGPEYAGLVSVVREKIGAGYVVAIGHRCHYQGREFIHFVLRRGEAAFSLVITKKEGESFTRDPRLIALEASGVSLYQASMQKQQVAAFETRDHLVYVVSEMPAAENLEVAARLALPVKAYIGKMEG
jgi:anti-sigma factor (TIGR02949 family)